ncbi:tripartite motif-containing protein 16-like [Polypterus senegalus]|uniref:tripartite motif-containing protein 16-like n=1 Tax=Polypterus senegalus TaxID=55291 RepID=UPI001964992B|nr:tripartite motif-containing protein 16-like [Polypterus senegalus]
MFSNTISKSERRPYSGVPGVVECQECTGSKQMAVNSCLTCLISFCETHIQSHKENEAFKGHRLVTPDVNLPQKICSKHHMLKEVFCTTDQESICFKCVLFEHKSHRTLTPEAGRSEKQEQVAETMQEIQKRMQMNEEKVKAIKTALPEFKTFVEEKKKEYEETFDFLLQSITRQKSEIMKSITEYEQREEEKAKDLITTLENETDELRMRDIQLEEITKMDDDIHFLQTFPAFHASLGERNTEDITINGNLFRDKLSKNLNYLKKLLDKLSNFKFEEKTDPGLSRILKNLRQPTETKELKTEVKNDEKYVIKHEKEQLRSCSTDCVEPKNEAKITSQEENTEQRNETPGPEKEGETKHGKDQLHPHSADYKELKTEVRNEEKDVIKHKKEQLRSCSTDCVEPNNDAKFTSQDENTGQRNVSTGPKKEGEKKHKKDQPCSLSIVNEVQVIGGENTFGARQEFLRRLNKMKSDHHQPFFNTKSKLVLLFCSVVSRLGKDISHALRQVSAGPKIILIIMHHTPDPDHILADSSKFVEEKDVLLTVDCLFHENNGLHNSSLNQAALKRFSML